MEKGQPITFRLPKQRLQELQGLAIIDGESSVADQVRKAIGEYVVARIEDPTLPSQIEQAKSRRDEVLMKLTER